LPAAAFADSTGVVLAAGAVCAQPHSAGASASVSASAAIRVRFIWNSWNKENVRQ
jgi:hypothetical protein